MHWVLTIICLFFSSTLLAKQETLKVFAAASLSDVLQEIVKEYKGSKVIFNFDATSKLAKQIEAGAPADVFFSADLEWMDHLEKNKKILADTRTPLVSNRVVLVVPADSKMIPETPKDLLKKEYRHIALASESVPAGRFARSVLKSTGLLKDLDKKIVNASNVRVALNWVIKHEAEAGIVYFTDAMIDSKVKIAFTFKEETHPKIIYPAAVTTKSTQMEEAKKFVNFFRSEYAKKKFKEAGFINL